MKKLIIALLLLSSVCWAGGRSGAIEQSELVVLDKYVKQTWSRQFCPTCNTWSDGYVCKDAELHEINYRLKRIEDKLNSGYVLPVVPYQLYDGKIEPIKCEGETK